MVRFPSVEKAGALDLSPVPMTLLVGVLPRLRGEKVDSSTIRIW